MKRCQVRGRIDARFTPRERDDLDSSGMSKEEALCPGLTGEREQFAEIGTRNNGRDADGPTVPAGDGTQSRCGQRVDEGVQMFGRDMRLIAHHEERSLRLRSQGSDSSLQRRTHAGLPRGVLNDAGTQSPELFSQTLGLIAEDNHDILNQRGACRLRCVTEERAAMDLDELLRGSHAGRAAGSHNHRGGCHV
jgi:hypothetical protein